MDSKNQNFGFGVVNYLLAIEWEGFEIGKKLAIQSFLRSGKCLERILKREGKLSRQFFFSLFLLSELN